MGKVRSSDHLRSRRSRCIGAMRTPEVSPSINGGMTFRFYLFVLVSVSLFFSMLKMLSARMMLQEQAEESCSDQILRASRPSFSQVGSLGILRREANSGQ